MKAVRFKHFGEPRVLQIVDVDLPKVAYDELLIAVYAAGINPIDGKIRDGSSFVSQKLATCLPLGLGYDLCGKVVQCGQMINEFKIGDMVLGSIGRYYQPGTYAQYAIVKCDEVILKPSILSTTSAAALPLAGLTALQALYQHGKLQKGERVLIHAAAGGVGHLAVQLAKTKGAEVIATASTLHHAFLQSIGVDQIIDYTQQPFETVVHDIDLVIDLVGGQTGVKSLKVLKSTGRIVTVPTITRDLVLASAKARGISSTGMLTQINKSQLTQLTQMLTNGELSLKIAAKWALGDVMMAHEMLDARHTAGKIILEINSS